MCLVCPSASSELLHDQTLPIDNSSGKSTVTIEVIEDNQMFRLSFCGYQVPMGETNGKLVKVK